MATLKFSPRNTIVAGQLSDGAGRPQIKSIDANWVNLNTFTLADHHKENCRVRPAWLSGARTKTPVALIVFHTKSSIPDRWIEAVINAEYESGLVLHMHSYDITANAEMYEHGGSCDHFHSYASAGTEHIQSGHCAILITVKSAPEPPLNEGNALPDQSVAVPAQPVDQ